MCITLWKFHQIDLMCKFFESWIWSNCLNIRFIVDFGLSDVSVNLTLRTEFSLSSIVHLWLHLSFAKQNKFLFVCAFPQIMNYSSANETCYLYTTAIRKTCRSTHTKKMPQFEKWASISTIVSLRRSHCSCDFSLNTKLRVDGTISTTFYSTFTSICSFLVFICFAIFLKAPACESLLILFWKTTREKKTNSTGQIDAVNFFFCNISTV